MIKKLMGILLLLLVCSLGFSQSPNKNSWKKEMEIIPGAARLELYIPMIKNKSVAIFANHTSVINQIHLVDTLQKLGIVIKKIFAPEHGFRGTADAGEKVENVVDSATTIPVVSLYGNKRKPSEEDLADVDLLIFDIQDAGARFYTYISSLQDYMEAAIGNDKPLLILDRPNPNGFYVDGPVLDKKFASFVGMQPVPIVYGMTIGEYAKMLIGENWLHLDPNNRFKKPQITVIPCGNYDHTKKYLLPVNPSPNLPSMQSIYLYPSTCFFEGTILSEGRGTDKPFQVFGHPSFPTYLYSFTPKSKDGAKNPKLQDKICYGWDLSGSNEEVLKKINKKIQLKWLINAYELFPQKDSFFLREGAIFNRLAGNDVLIRQIKAGKQESEIHRSWEPALAKFKKTRKKYLLYKDF